MPAGASSYVVPKECLRTFFARLDGWDVAKPAPLSDAVAAAPAGAGEPAVRPAAQASIVRTERLITVSLISIGESFQSSWSG